MKTILLITIAMLSVLAPAQETSAERIARFEKLSLSLGSTYSGTWIAASKILRGPVNDEKAYVLAKAYFYAFVNGCGFLELPIDGGRTWNFKAREGIAGWPGRCIFVDKSTGTTWTDKKVLQLYGKRLVEVLPKPVTDPKIYLSRVDKRKR